MALVGAVGVCFERTVDRLACVFDEIGDGLREQTLIGKRHRGLVWQVEIKGDFGAAHLEQEHRLTHDIAHVVTFHHRLRHPREGRELVDHAADVRHLANDGVGALVEHVAVLGDGVAVFAADTLGGKLDRRERILDLMSDAARHVGPGGAALSADQLGDVIEGQDIALRLLITAFGGDADGEIALRSRPMQRDLLGDEALALLLRPLHHRGEFGDHRGEGLADESAFLHAQQVLGGAVDEGDGTIGIEANDAGGDAGEHRLHETAPFVERRVGADQRIPLALELRGHGVEGGAEHGEIAVGRFGVDGDIEIAAGDLLGRAHQLADRRDKAVREPHADPDGGQQQGQRDGHVHQPEGDLHPRPALLEKLIFRGVGACFAQLLQHLRIHRTEHVEVGIVEIVQRFDRANERGLPRRDDDDLAALGEIHGGFWRRLIGHVFERSRGGENLAVAIDQIGDRQRPDRGLRGEEIAEGLRPGLHQIDRLVDVLGHAEGIGADHLPMFLDIGRGHFDRIADDRLGARREPMIEAAVERDAGKDSKQDRRDHGNHAEQADDAHMQLRARGLASPGQPQSRDLPGDDHHHGDHEHEVDEQHAHHDEVGRHDGREAGQDDVGRKAGAERQDHDDQAEGERETPAAGSRRYWGRTGCGLGTGPLFAFGGAPGGLGAYQVRRLLALARMPQRQAFRHSLPPVQGATQPLSPFAKRVF